MKTYPFVIKSPLWLFQADTTLHEAYVAEVNRSPGVPNLMPEQVSVLFEELPPWVTPGDRFGAALLVQRQQHWQLITSDTTNEKKRWFGPSAIENVFVDKDTTAHLPMVDSATQDHRSEVLRTMRCSDDRVAEWPEVLLEMVNTRVEVPSWALRLFNRDPGTGRVSPQAFLVWALVRRWREAEAARGLDRSAQDLMLGLGMDAVGHHACAEVEEARRRHGAVSAGSSV